MTQSRRAFIATVAAATACPALPAIAASPLVEPWPPEILELERVARQIYECQAKQDLYSIMHNNPDICLFEDKAEACFQRGLARYLLLKLAPEHEPARMALAQYLADGTLPVSPRPVPPFLP